MKLGSSRNQCGVCKQYFNSIPAFEKHRTGKYGVDRRCLNDDEMMAKKMEKNAAKFWTTGLMNQAEKDRAYAIHKQKKTVRQGI